MSVPCVFCRLKCSLVLNVTGPVPGSEAGNGFLAAAVGSECHPGREKVGRDALHCSLSLPAAYQGTSRKRPHFGWSGRTLSSHVRSCSSIRSCHILFTTEIINSRITCEQRGFNYSGAAVGPNLRQKRKILLSY